MPEREKPEFNEGRSGIEAELVLVERNLRNLEKLTEDLAILAGRENNKVKKNLLEAELRKRMEDWYIVKAEADMLRVKLSQWEK